MGELTTSIVHELNQPLSAILTNAQVGRRSLNIVSPDLTELNDILGDIIADNVRASKMIDRLRTLAGKGKIELGPLDLNEIIKEVIEIARNDLIMKCVSVSVDLDPDLPIIRGDRVQLEQVLLNLIKNGSEAINDSCGQACELTIRTGKLEEERVLVSACDCGGGIGKEDLEQVFTPLYSTKSGGWGWGSRSAGQSLKPTMAGYGHRTIRAGERHSFLL